MKQQLNINEEIEAFMLNPQELALVTSKHKTTRIGFAVLLKYFQLEYCFPSIKSEVPKNMLQFIAKQLQLPFELYSTYQFDSRTTHRHKQEVLQFCGFKEGQDKDREFIQIWLYNRIFEYNLDATLLKKQLYVKYQTERIVAPSEWQINRLVHQLIFQREQDFYQETYNKLSVNTLKRIDDLLDYWGHKWVFL